MTDDVAFVADPQLIAIGTFLVPIATELFTHVNATSKVKQHVATAIVVLVLLGSLALELVIRGSIEPTDVGDWTSLVMLMVAQFGVVRAAVEGGHKGYDAVESRTGHMENVLAPNFGVGRDSQPAVA